MTLRTAAALLLLALALPCVPAAAAPLNGRDPADDIFYMYMPIAWRDSNGDPQRFGDFGGMKDGLGYLRDLGVTAVWMTPIFTSPAYHGYQHMPADQINPWFGTEAGFLDFVNTAHADSVKVFIDLVCYGVSTNSVYFQDSYLNPASPYTDYLAYYDAHTGNSSYDGSSYTSWNGSGVGFVRWNLLHPPATQLVTGWSRHWLDPDGDGDPAEGVDGYRLDHVLAYDTWGYTIDWWQDWKAALQQVNPSAFTFAEQADWGSHGQDLLSAHDAAFTKPFEFAARAALGSESAAGLYSEMRSTLASLPPGGLYLCTLSDHDVNRLMSDIGNNWGRARAAAAIQMTQPFPPVLYFGDELGMRGTKANYGSDANDIPFREPFKWKAVAGPPMSNYFVLNSQAYNNRVERNNDGRSVEEQQGVAGSLLETYRSLIFTRRNHVALRRGSYAEIPNTRTAVWAFARHAAGQETLLVAINLSGAAVNTALDLSNFDVTDGRSVVRDVQSGAQLADLTTANRSAYPLSLPAYGWAILNAAVTPVPAPPTTGVDGRDIPEDFAAGTLVATQTNGTGLGDNVNELDQMFVLPDSAGLHLGITGNLGTYGTALALFFDTAPGGQNTLETAAFPEPPTGLPELNGLVLDQGFEPDLALWVNGYGATLYVDRYPLILGGGGTKRYVGSTLLNLGTGDLSGGDNPNGLRAACDITNLAGVTATSAAGAATATSGFEAFLPWADLLMSGPGAPIRVLAVIVQANGSVGNQFLPGLAAGTPNLGPVPLSLRDVPGDQFAIVSTTTVAAVAPERPARAGLTLSPNPFRDATWLRFALARAAQVRVEIFDPAGRRVRDLGARFLDAGPHAIAWDGRDDGGRGTGPGLYFARVGTAERTLDAKVLRLR
ncbi:MAG: hypothetical protein A2V63_08090 [Candidatus Eisenbacteria bacterium RBG_19FT_COMBO_70_11]|nr:MAG: hypothetical protein A2V63_08090 [Candidatus Eisenbacteria bacterium RBG_19FT_COMBO_70_11]